MARQFAFRLSLLAFAVSTFRGVLNGSDFQGAMQWALVAAATFFVLGFVVGELGRLLVEDNARSEFKGMQLARQTTATSNRPAE